MLPQERHAMACPTGVRHDFCCVMKKQTISNSSSQALCLGSTACDGGTKEVVDARHKAWHDGETAKHRETPTRFHISVIVTSRQSAKSQGIRTIGKNRAGHPWACPWYPRLSCSTKASRGCSAQGRA